MRSVAKSSEHPTSLREGAGFLLLGILLGVVMIVASKAIYAVEGGVSSLATLLPVGYAFAAGMVATVNPCGVLLLPSLVAYYLGQDASTERPGWDRAGRALLLGVMATLGFVVLFAVVGLIVGAGGQALESAFPAGGLLVGIALVGLGVWLALSGRELGLVAASRTMGKVRLGRNPLSLFAFGVAYAVASLACTLPVFLVVVGSALATGGILAGVSQFIGYALGMGAVLTVVILVAAFFQGLAHRSVRRVAPYVHRLSAAFLVGAGLFLVHYWLAG